MYYLTVVVVTIKDVSISEIIFDIRKFMSYQTVNELSLLVVINGSL